MILRLFLIFAVSFASPVLSQTSSTETHYVAPIGAALNITPDGSLDNPWPSVNAALSSGKINGGETLLLMDGDYGELRLYKNSFDIPIVIRSLNGKRAHFDKINIGGYSKNIVFQDLSVWPSDPSSASGVLVFSHPTSSNITITGIDVRSTEKADAFFNWDLGYWRNHNALGIVLRGNNSIARNNRIIGASVGIEVWGDDSGIINNIVNGFSGDGLRALGDRNVIRGNRVTNAFKVSENHDDGIQSWANSGRESIEGLVIEDNTIIEWTGPAGHPLRSPLQGIGLFGGFYDNLVVSSNSISVTQWHGLSVYAGRNAVITNNTVVHNDGVIGGRPWIGIFDQQVTGIPSTNVLVANNVAMLLRGTSESVVFTDNSVIFEPAAAFEDISTFDYRPKTNSGFVDTANTNYAPPFDIAGNARPIGAGPDRGAYEAGGKLDSGTTDAETTGGTTDGGRTGGTADDGTTDGGTADSTTGGGTAGGTTAGGGKGWRAKWLVPPGHQQRRRR